MKKTLINNDRKLIRKGGRYAVPISEEELKEKIIEVLKDADFSLGCDEYGDCFSFEDGVEELCCPDEPIKHSRIFKDISKVDFSLENFMCRDIGAPNTSGNWEGFHTLPTGLAFLGCRAGGDWEYPVNFAIYYDGKDLRGYIPRYHNSYNLKTKTAFGNDDEMGYDEEIIRYLGLEHDKDEFYSADGRYLYAEWNFEDVGLYEDISSRIEIRDATGKSGMSVSKACCPSEIHCPPKEIERTVVAILKIDDSRAIDADMGTIDYLETVLSPLAYSGIVLDEARILDDDDPSDAMAMIHSKAIFEEEI